MRRAAFVAVVGLALTIAAAPSRAAAQFTAALVPPPPVPRVDTVAQVDSARQAARELEDRMTAIKAWVDSAAAALAAQPAAVPPVEADTARMPEMPQVPSDTSRARAAPPDTSTTRPRQPRR
jgi:hypothetical protein